MLIDRYITRAQLGAFLIVFVSLAGLTFVVDAFTNIEDFISHGRKAGGLWRVLATYYGCRTIQFFDATSAVVTLASAMFALSWLERHNEITALLAAGVTRWRIARPVLVFAAVVAGLAAVNREVVIPQIRHTFARNAQDLEGNSQADFESRYDHRTEILFRGRSAQAAAGRIELPSLLLPPPLAGLGPQIDAAEAFWRPASDGRPSGYLLAGVTEPKGIDDTPTASIGGEAVVLTRRDHNWLRDGECFVVSDVSFEQMIGSSNWSQYSSTVELIRAGMNPSLGVSADVPLRVHARLVSPLVDLTLTLLGLPLVLGPIRRGIFNAVGLCIGLTATFFLVVLACHSMTIAYILSPSMGAWMPLMILATLAAWRSQPMWQ
ncbi:MAG: LptF/LptG family permease [Planctomycetaceae bacterium]